MESKYSTLALLIGRVHCYWHIYAQFQMDPSIKSLKSGNREWTNVSNPHTASPPAASGISCILRKYLESSAKTFQNKAWIWQQNTKEFMLLPITWKFPEYNSRNEAHEIFTFLQAS